MVAYIKKTILKTSLIPMLTIVFSINTAVSASDLKDIVESSEMQRFARDSNDAPDTAGLTPGTNLYQLFSAREEKAMIDLWFDIPDGEFKLVKSKAGLDDDVRSSTRIYQSKSATEVVFHVLVPHPRQEDAARFRLLAQFAAHTTRQAPKFIEDVEVQNRKAQLLTLADGKCQVNVDLARGALAVFQANCANTSDLLRFIESTSMDRFEQKVNS